VIGASSLSKYYRPSLSNPVSSGGRDVASVCQAGTMGRSPRAAGPVLAGAPFESRRLRVDAGLNRLVISGHVGAPHDIVGREARALLSAAAVRELGATHGLSLARASVADDLRRAYGSEVPGQRQAAATVMAETGHRLAWVLATLHAPGTAADQGWSPWRQDYLRHWANVGEVGIAGGLMASAVGEVVVDATNRALRGLGVPVSSRLVPRPELAGMLGAARCAGVADGTVVAVDLGHSTAKSGLVRMCQGEVSDLRISRRADVGLDPGSPVPVEQLETLLDDVLLAAAADALEHAARVDAIAFSVACYMAGPASERSAYSGMPDLGGAEWRAKLQAVFGRRLNVEVLHDGTAAASAWAPSPGSVSATVTLGTYLAVGFPA
jgi:hypothetical protein